MPEVSVVPECADDYAAIRDVTAAAFEPKAFSDGTEAGLPDALRAAGALSLSLVAKDGGAVVGHIALSPVTVGRAGGWYGLGPIAVRPDRQGEGIGASLIEAATDWLKETGAAGCVLVGDPGYYSRFGFFSDGQVTYGDLAAHLVQRIVVAGPDAAGEVTFHDAFGDGS